MERIQFVTHQGRRILVIDFSAIASPSEVLKTIEAAKQYVAGLPQTPKLLTLTKVDGVRFNDETVQAMRKYAEHNTPWVQAGAIVGMSSLHRIIHRMINMTSGRSLQAFDNEGAAKDWLVKQAAAPV